MHKKSNNKVNMLKPITAEMIVLPDVLVSTCVIIIFSGGSDASGTPYWALKSNLLNRCAIVYVSPAAAGVGIYDLRFFYSSLPNINISWGLISCMCLRTLIRKCILIIVQTKWKETINTEKLQLQTLSNSN